MTKDKIFNWRFCLCCGIFIWFVLNLLQGIFTEIQEDEAYYALYGEHLAWGYYDHPPMVGLMTFLSSIFFSGTLGVRFFTIIASCLSLWVIWMIANPEYFKLGLFESPLSPLKGGDAKHQLNNSKLPTDSQLSTLNSKLFLIIAFSIVMFNIYGFVTTPDASLILFSALFLFVYQRYLVESTWPRAFLMGLLMACMIYSKYHAFLFLGLIVLSNLKLLKNGKFWVACLLALALLTPHILWQVNNGFPSFRYHLAGRNEAFKWSYFFEYLPNQLLIFNPFTFGAVVYVLIRNRNCVIIPPALLKRGRSEAQQTGDEVFERGLKFILIGFFFFFWLMAFRGHVEPHWTIVCVIPMVVLVYRKALVDNKLRKYTKFVILPSLLLVLTLRILLLTPLADRFGYHGKEKYYKAVEQVAGDRPMVYQGSFQQAALYHYFTGKESSPLQSYYDRMTQYDLWQFDKAWIGKPVFICGHVNERSETYQVGDVEIEGFLTDNFSSANRLVTTFEITNADGDKTPVFHHGDTIHVDFSIYNPCEAPIDFHHKDFGMVVKAHYLPGDAFSFCFYKDFGIIDGQTSYQGQLYTIVNDEIGLGEHLFNLGIGDRVSAFVTEESGVKIRIEP
ncbi:MAG: glycosyltransferase family 39 protein [Bacteroidales bacterium]|nr:glycosyltransferase family 39 protein [Bacteroidales bacterium]